MPSVRLNPYLNFATTARDAMEFYKSVFGGTLTLSTFADGGMPHEPAQGNLVMHAMLEGDHGVVLMASDAPPGMPLSNGSTMSVSLSGDDDAALSGYWDKLASGGTVTMPFAMAPWGDKFGMCTDKFGIAWLVNVAGKKS